MASSFLILFAVLIHAKESDDRIDYSIKSVNGIIGVEYFIKAEEIIPFDTLQPEEKTCTDFTYRFGGGLEIIKAYKITSQNNSEVINILKEDSEETRYKVFVCNYGRVCRGDTISYIRKISGSTISAMHLSKSRSSTTVNIVSEIPVCLHFTGKKYKIHYGKLDSPLKNIKVTLYHNNDEAYYDKGKGEIDKKILKDMFVIYKDVGWKDVVLDYYAEKEKYEIEINRKLPFELLNIVKGAKQIKDDKTQIKYITSRLVKYAEYKRDYNNVFPESFEKTIKKKNGNCKELATMTSAILKTLGYEVTPVLMDLASQINFPYNIPALATWNWGHVVVYAISPKKGEYLIDPAIFIYEFKADDINHQKVLLNKKITIQHIKYLKNGEFSNFIASILCYFLSWNDKLINPQKMLFLDTKMPYIIKLFKQKNNLILKKLHY